MTPVGCRFVWVVDPGSGGQGAWFGVFTYKPFGVAGVGAEHLGVV